MALAVLETGETWGVYTSGGSIVGALYGNTTSSGKNIFDVALTFTGSTCGLGNGASTKGIAYYDATTRRVIAMAMNTAKSDGFIYVGQK